MKLPLMIFGIVALTLIAIGPPGARTPVPSSSDSAVFTPSSVSANGFTLISTSVDIPADEQSYPGGSDADVINTHCLSCHSASMILTQPRLDKEKWAGIVHKMQEVYKAPVSDAEAAQIVDYLSRRASDALPEI